MLYRHYHIQYTKNDKGEYRWIIDDDIAPSDDTGREGFETKEEAFHYIDSLMKSSGRAHMALDPIFRQGGTQDIKPENQ